MFILSRMKPCNLSSQVSMILNALRLLHVPEAQPVNPAFHLISAGNCLSSAQQAWIAGLTAELTVNDKALPHSWCGHSAQSRRPLHGNSFEVSILWQSHGHALRCLRSPVKRCCQL